MTEIGGQSGEQQSTAAGAPGYSDGAAGNSDGQGTGGFSAPPAINLPKGGGAIRGMGEKFAANPVTGTGSMTVPIATSHEVELERLCQLHELPRGYHTHRKWIEPQGGDDRAFQ